MTNRFIYFFLSTSILVSIYFFIESYEKVALNIVDRILDNILYIYDYILFCIYSTYLAIKFRKWQLLLLATHYFILIFYSLVIDGNYYKDIFNVTFFNFYTFHITARLFLFAFFIIILRTQKAKNDWYYYFILFFVSFFPSIVITFTVGQTFESTSSLIHQFVFFLVDFSIAILFLLKLDISKSENKLIFLGILLIVFSDYLYSQNEAMKHIEYSLSILRIINTLGEFLIMMVGTTFVLDKKRN